MSPAVAMCLGPGHWVRDVYTNRCFHVGSSNYLLSIPTHPSAPESVSLLLMLQKLSIRLKPTAGGKPIKLWLLYLCFTRKGFGRVITNRQTCPLIERCDFKGMRVHVPALIHVCVCVFIDSSCDVTVWRTRKPTIWTRLRSLRPVHEKNGSGGGHTSN